jgi:hypothetical protein
MKEINAIPTPDAARNKPAAVLPIDGLPPFPSKVMKDYEADYDSLTALQRTVEQNKDRYPLRAAIFNAIKEMDDSAKKFQARQSFSGAVTDAIKKKILVEQRAPGLMISNLEGALTLLEKAGKNRDKETSKRWQAHFDLTLARLKSRLVMLYEYDHLLAQIRGDTLPPLTEGATGYVLAPRKKVQISENVVKTWVKEINLTWQKILRDHKDTPWEVMARREQSTVLGMEWRPYRP